MSVADLQKSIRAKEDAIAVLQNSPYLNAEQIAIRIADNQSDINMLRGAIHGINGPSGEDMLALVDDVKIARAELAQAKVQADRVKAQAGFKPGPLPGVDAMPFEGGGGTIGGGVADEVESRVVALMSADRNISRGRAMGAVLREDPGLRQAMIDEASQR